MWGASPTYKKANHYCTSTITEIFPCCPQNYVCLSKYFTSFPFSSFSQAKDLVLIPSDGRFPWLTWLDFNFYGFFSIWSVLMELLLGMPNAALLCCSWSSWRPSKGPEPTSRKKHTTIPDPGSLFLHSPSKTPLLNESVFQQVQCMLSSEHFFFSLKQVNCS